MKYDKIGLRIAEIRKHRGLTQMQLANEAGVNYNTLRKIETGKTKNPRIDNLFGLNSNCVTANNLEYKLLTKKELNKSIKLMKKFLMQNSADEKFKILNYHGYVTNVLPNIIS